MIKCILYDYTVNSSILTYLHKNIVLLDVRKFFISTFGKDTGDSPAPGENLGKPVTPSIFLFHFS